MASCFLSKRAEKCIGWIRRLHKKMHMIYARLNCRGGENCHFRQGVTKGRKYTRNRASTKKNRKQHFPRRYYVGYIRVPTICSHQGQIHFFLRGPDTRMMYEYIYVEYGSRLLCCHDIYICMNIFRKWGWRAARSCDSILQLIGTLPNPHVSTALTLAGNMVRSLRAGIG